jgi:hypothetical protein
MSEFQSPENEKTLKMKVFENPYELVLKLPSKKKHVTRFQEVYSVE